MYIVHCVYDWKLCLVQLQCLATIELTVAHVHPHWSLSPGSAIIRYPILGVLHCSPLYPLFDMIIYTAVCGLLLNILVACKIHDMLLL